MVFKSNELVPGFYELCVEYRNRKCFEDSIYMFQGINKYILEDFRLNFDYRQDEQLV